MGPKLCGNCAFPQNFRTRKLGQFTPFFRSDKFTESLVCLQNGDVKWSGGELISSGHI